MSNLSNKDWHRTDIMAAIRKKTTLAALSRENGLSSSTLMNALDRPWRKGELIIANKIGVPAHIIWPSRYFDEQGNPIERPLRKNVVNQLKTNI